MNPEDLDGGPEENCGAQCDAQAHDIIGRYYVGELKNNTGMALSNFTESVASVVSKGPLLSTAMALFTRGSYLDIHRTVAEAYSHGSPNDWGGCIDVIPMIKLLHGPDSILLSTHLDPCVYAADTIHGQLPTLVASYIWLFAAQERKYSFNVASPSKKEIEAAFTATAILAVDVWMQRASAEFYETDTSGSVGWDLGVDQQVPDIPQGGVILISTLLGLYLICILTLSVYAAWTPRWTNQLDSFAMMRMGSAAAGHFPLELAHNPDDIKELDNRPGWIGGTTCEERDTDHCTNELDLGGEESLSGKKRYRCYRTEESS